MTSIEKILIAAIKCRQQVGDVDEQTACAHFLRVLHDHPYETPKTSSHAKKAQKTGR